MPHFASLLFLCQLTSSSLDIFQYICQIYWKDREKKNHIPTKPTYTETTHCVVYSIWPITSERFTKANQILKDIHTSKLMRHSGRETIAVIAKEGG